MSEDDQQAKQADDNKVISRPQKIYLKDVSFESPNSPELFTTKWDPKLGVELNNSVSVLGDDLYEVILSVTATVSVNDKTAFLAEVQQAGIYFLQGHEPDVLQRVQQVYWNPVLVPVIKIVWLIMSLYIIVKYLLDDYNSLQHLWFYIFL